MNIHVHAKLAGYDVT